MKLPKILKNKKVMIVATGIVLLLAFGYVQTGSIYGSGWETDAVILGIQTDGRSITANSVIAEKTSVGAYQWSIDPDTQGTINRYGFGAPVPVQLDMSQVGMPDIIVSSAAPAHVNWQGTVTAANLPVDSYTTTLADGSVRIYDLHLFKFSVTIRTDADKGFENTLLYSETTADPDFQQFSGSVFVEFSLNPWEYRFSLPDDPTAQLDEFWAGVMSASIQETDEGLVTGTASPDTEWTATPHYSVGSQVNMYTDFNGISYGGANFPTSGAPDPSIRSSAVLEFGATLRSGARLYQNWLGAVIDLDTSNVFVSYDVEVQVLTMHQFYLQSNPDPAGGGEEDPDEGSSDRDDPVDLFGYFLGSLGESFANAFQNPLSWIMIFILLSLGMVTVIFFLRRKTQVMIP